MLLLRSQDDKLRTLCSVYIQRYIFVNVFKMFNKIYTKDLLNKLQIVPHSENVPTYFDR